MNDQPLHPQQGEHKLRQLHLAPTLEEGDELSENLKLQNQRELIENELKELYKNLELLRQLNETYRRNRF